MQLIYCLHRLVSEESKDLETWTDEYISYLFFAVTESSQLPSHRSTCILDKEAGRRFISKSCTASLIFPLLCTLCNLGKHASLRPSYVNPILIQRAGSLSLFWMANEVKLIVGPEDKTGITFDSALGVESSSWPGNHLSLLPSWSRFLHLEDAHLRYLKDGYQFWQREYF